MKLKYIIPLCAMVTAAGGAELNNAVRYDRYLSMHAERSSIEPPAGVRLPGQVFRDCPDCPDMVVMPTGRFDMGSLTGTDEHPVHRVTIGHHFAIGRTEVTQRQWSTVMGDNPGKFTSCGDDCPVEQVSWNDVQAFIQKLNARTGQHYRLPSEAEWEYACRAGERHKYCGGNDPDTVAWYGFYATPKGNSRQTTYPVATRQANAWGLYDMSGNVREWVEDSYHENYRGAPADGSVWMGTGGERVLRGGSWFYSANLARASVRVSFVPGLRDVDFGFRLALTLP
ncbi:MAG: formylglycine-generating enzyme family protein [Gallionella sp.]|nr:formylglycine-generating enzyme family protein [Gallionella sp.]